MESTEIHAAAAHWSAREGLPGSGEHWWEHQLIVRHVNQVICGRPATGIAGGDVEVLRERRFAQAVSIGCGSGSKEMALLSTGVVGHFHLYEVAEARVARGREEAERRGLADRMSWHCQPADFSRPEQVDLVYWNNALHHMLDVERAVAWSRASGQALYMNDYVGPDRFQWPDEMLSAANEIRTILGAPPLSRPDPELLARDDPTEAAQSEQILPAIRRHFPDAAIRPTGGVVYHLALRGLLKRVDETLLRALLVVDRLYAERGLTHYAIALA